MTLRLGQVAPDFEQDTANGSIRLYPWLASDWGLLFSYPRDFMPVAAEELVDVARLKLEWDRRAVRPVGLSVDSAETHRAFEQFVVVTKGHGFTFPVVADTDRSVAELYGMLDTDAHPEATASCLFLIDPGKRVRLMLTHPVGVARNFRDVLRVIDTLQGADVPTTSPPMRDAPTSRFGRQA
jgi:alkyl hydroperoxide reductase subunit AhpC